jgi:hypothetical protein
MLLERADTFEREWLEFHPLLNGGVSRRKERIWTAEEKLVIVKNRCIVLWAQSCNDSIGGLSFRKNM